MRLLLVLVSAFALLGCGDAADKSDSGGGSGAGNGSAKPVLKFSAIPDEKPTENAERFRPVAKYLAGALGIEVEYVPVRDYSASVQAFKTGDIHFAWFGGLSGVQARLAVPGAQAIAQGVEDPEYFSYFIANKKTGLKRGDEFPTGSKGMKFTFGSEGSTSGRLMPEFFIREATGGAPKDYYPTVGFSGNHPATIAAVNSGAYDIGALSYKTYDKASPEEKANALIIWKTPVYADYNLTAHPDIDKAFGPGFTGKLKQAWLAMPKDLCEKSFSRSGMIEAKNSDFQAIEDTAKSLDLAR